MFNTSLLLYQYFSQYPYSLFPHEMTQFLSFFRQLSNWSHWTRVADWITGQSIWSQWQVSITGCCSVPQWSFWEGLSLSQTTVNHDGYIWAHTAAGLMKLCMKTSKPNNMPEMRYERKIWSCPEEKQWAWPKVIVSQTLSFYVYTEVVELLQE